MEARWIDRLFGCLFVVFAAVLVVLMCVVPSRHSDGRLVEEAAREMREMYDAGLDGGGDW